MSKRVYLEECWRRAKQHWLFAIIAALSFIYSLATEWSPFVGPLAKWLQPDKLPKMPLPWALAVGLTCLSLILYLGGSQLAQELAAFPSGPDVVVEYSYKVEGMFPRAETTPKLSAPLVLVNTSAEHVAKNVRVLPITVGEQEGRFVPDVIPYIEPKGRQQVHVQIENIFPPFRHDLPRLLRAAYKDTSTEELFGEHPFVLRVEYEDADGNRRYETAATLLYHNWKNEVRIGETKRKLNLQRG